MKRKGASGSDVVVTLFVIAVICSLVAGGCWGYPQYQVYTQRLAGAAKLAEAESSRQILVQEAQAKMDSAKMLAAAEVERAKGVAEANQIIGDSLKGNDEYLRYLWIHNLEAGNNAVIYVPTEAGLPILEAGRRPDGKPQPTADLPAEASP